MHSSTNIKDSQSLTKLLPKGLKLFSSFLNPTVCYSTQFHFIQNLNYFSVHEMVPVLGSLSHTSIAPSPQQFGRIQQAATVWDETSDDCSTTTSGLSFPSQTGQLSQRVGCQDSARFLCFGLQHLLHSLVRDHATNIQYSKPGRHPE